MSNSISQDFKLFSLLKFALPSMIMMVFMSLYTIIDGILAFPFILRRHVCCKCCFKRSLLQQGNHIWGLR